MAEMCGFVVLAAGNASRMGKVKALLPYNGKTLLQHLLTEIGENAPVIVVTGASHETLETLSYSTNVRIVYNSEWPEGMGSSIRRAMQRVRTDFPEWDSVIIAVCDQPHMCSSLFQKMLDMKTMSRKGIIACAYAGILGTPVLFDKKYFSALAALEGAGGAKPLLRLHADDVATVDFPKGAIDIDTPQDYTKLMTP